MKTWNKIHTFWTHQRCRDYCYTEWCLCSQPLTHSGE